MKKIVLLFLALMLVVPFSYAAYAKGIKFEHIAVFDDEQLVAVTMKNNDGDMNLKVSAVIPELGIISTRGPVMLNSGGRVSMALLIQDVPASSSGEYVLRLAAKDGNIRRVKHRLIIIK